MKDQKYYQDKFKDYPDLVNTMQFRQMLGGVGDAFARKLIQEKRVKSFFIKPKYLIPKCSVIEYILSEDYETRRLKKRV